MSTPTKLLLTFAALLPVAARAEQPVEKPVSSEFTTSASAALGYTSRAQYDRNPLERTYVNANLGLTYADVHSFGLSQALNYRHGSDRYYGEKNGPIEELYASDTNLSYGYGKNLLPQLEAKNMELGIGGSAVLGTSRQSTTEDHFKGSVGADLELSWKAHQYLTLVPALGTNYYFYDSEDNEDGEANSQYDVSAGVTAATKYEKISFSQNVTFYKSYLYMGYRPLYTFSNRSSLGYAINDRLSLRMSLTTSDNQLRYGRNRNFKMYDKDITRFTIELASKLL